jgi:hypothetical protein
MKPHKWAKEIIAFVNGEDVEGFYKLGKFYPTGLSDFDDHDYTFRIAPKEQYTILITTSIVSVLHTRPFPSKEEAKKHLEKYCNYTGYEYTIVRLVKE